MFSFKVIILDNRESIVGSYAVESEYSYQQTKEDIIDILDELNDTEGYKVRDISYRSYFKPSKFYGYYSPTVYNNWSPSNSQQQIDSETQASNVLGVIGQLGSESYKQGTELPKQKRLMLWSSLKNNWNT